MAERLLVRLLRFHSQGESIAGDLHEEYIGRAAGSSWGANAWYLLESVRIIVRIAGLGAVSRAGRMLQRRLGPESHYPTPSVRRTSACALSRIGGHPDSDGDSLMGTLGLEARHALRGIFKRPALAATLILTLALGLGANAAVFAIIDALVLRPFTMPDVDRLVLLSHARVDEIDRQETVSPADYLDLKRQSDVFERLAAFEWWEANLVGRDEPEAVLGFRVSADFFPALGVQPALGRALLSTEETLGQDQRVVLGYGLWQRRFAGDASIIGRPIEIDGAQFEVVGIAPQGFEFPMGSQLWAPLAFTAETAANRRSRYLTVIGRLAPGRTLDDAKAQMAVVGDRLEQQHPDTNRGFALHVYTLARGMMDIGLGPILSLWQTSALVVLLIACANVANLQLARAAERHRELAVRLAIGASRARVVRELLIGSTLVALVAVPAALGVAWAGLTLLRGAMPEKIARFVAGWQSIDVDGRLFLFTTLLAVSTSVVFGLLPALQSTPPRLADSLKTGGRTSTAGGGRLRLRRALVVAEVALALPLLVTCGLSLLSVHRYLNGPQGYNPDGLLTMQVALADARYPDDPSRRRYAERVVEALGSIPGVGAAAAVNNMPAGASNSGRGIEIQGQPNPDPANPPVVDYRTATPSIFEALELPILSGRGLTEADRENALRVAVVSESLVRRFWPESDPIGRRFRLRNGPWLTVVGVCGDVIQNWFARRYSPTVYLPLAQAPMGRMALLVRTDGDPHVAAALARQALREVDPVQPIFDLMTMRESLKERTIGLRYVAAIMTAFGGLALLLAVVGVYGVMAYTVTQRTHEIGVRMALGASKGDVLRLALGQTGRLTAGGVALGIALALALTRLIEAGLLGVVSSDVRIIAGFAAILVAAALAAGYLPARRAAGINPIVALQAE
jgi:putative ABC transport system permease protein